MNSSLHAWKFSFTNYESLQSGREKTQSGVIHVESGTLKNIKEIRIHGLFSGEAKSLCKRINDRHMK